MRDDMAWSRGYTYYQMSNLDNRISNPDQLLTQVLLSPPPHLSTHIGVPVVDFD